MITRPLKAPSAPLTEAQIASLQFPYYASFKKDGIRCLVHPTFGPVSQKMLPIPNHYIRETLISYGDAAHYLDGELVVPGFTFNENQSVIMSRWHPQQKLFRFLVFDMFRYPDLEYKMRMCHAHARVEKIDSPHVEWLSHDLIANQEQLAAFEEFAVRQGEEGIMLNAPE